MTDERGHNPHAPTDEQIKLGQVLDQKLCDIIENGMAVQTSSGEIVKVDAPPAILKTAVERLGRLGVPANPIKQTANLLEEAPSTPQLPEATTAEEEQRLMDEAIEDQEGQDSIDDAIENGVRAE